MLMNRPRRQPSKKATQIVFGIIGVIGLAWMIFGIFSYSQTNPLPGQPTAKGQVVDFTINTCPGYRADTPGPCWNAIVEFTAKDGKTYRAKSYKYIPNDEKDKTLGKTATVAYKTDNPNDNKVLDQSHAWLGIEAIGIFFIVATYLVYRHTRKTSNWQ